MIRRIGTPSAALAALLACAVATAATREAPSGPQGPGPEHRWLAEDEGAWTIAATIWPPGADEPIEAEGTSTMTMRFGRYLQEEFTVGEGPLAMQGVGLVGYDVELGEFRAVYCLNTGTALSLSTGQRSDDGAVLELVSESPAEAGETVRGRSTIRRAEDGTRVLEYFARRGDGPERKRFTMVYTRAE